MVGERNYCVKCVIFDMDDTLVENNIPFSHIREGIKNYISNLGIDVDSLWQSSLPTYENIVNIAKKYPKYEKNILDKFRELEISRAKKAKLKDDVPLIIEELKRRGIKIALVTRNCNDSVKIALGSFANKFDLILTRDNSRYLKPDERQIKYVLNTLKVKPKECVCVGDYDYDIIAARNAGCISVRIGEGFGDFVIKELKDLLNIIDAL